MDHVQRPLGWLCVGWLCLVLVASTAAQVIGPTIHSVGIDDGDNLRPGSTLVLRFTATAGSLPLESAMFSFTTTTGHYRAITTDTPQTGTISLTVTDDWPAGEYRLQSVTLTSKLGSSYVSAASGGFPGLVNVPGAIAPPGVSETLFLTRFVVTNPRAYVPPLMTGISRTGGAEVAAGTTLTFRPVFTPGSAALRRLFLQLRDPNGQFVNFETDALAGQVAVPIPSYWLNGKYTLNLVSFYDAAGASTGYYRGGQVNRTPGPVEHNVAFADMDFTVTGGASDFVFPTMQSFTLRTATAKVGETIAVDYVLVPGSRAIASVVFTFRGPIGSHRITATGGGVAGTASMTVPGEWVSGRYTLDRIDITDAGAYQTFYQSNRLVGFTPFGLRQTTSHALPITTTVFTVSEGIAPIPFITVQPKDVSVEPGSGTQLRIEASSPAGITYQWYEGVVGNTSKPIGNNGSVVFVQPASGTSYWVRLSNAYGSVDSQAATVTPRFTSDLPVILTPPSSVTRSIGNYASLDASVVGPGPLTYVWYKDGRPIAGATNARYELGTLSSSMSGTYHLVVTNPQGTVTTNPVQVTATERPRIVSQTRALTVRAGQRATFNVEATGGDLRYSWNSERSSASGASGSTYTIENVQRYDAGIYRVSIRNDSFETVNSDPMTLTVIDPDLPLPVIITPGDIVYTSVGALFGFMVGVLNDPLTVTVSSPLPPGASWSEQERRFGDPITLAGDYPVTFTATNASGRTSRTITVRVLPRPFAPIILKQPQSRQAYVDEHVELIADAVASPNGVFADLRYQWKKNGVPISGAVGSTLTFYAVRAGDAGTYTVEASNFVGITTSAPAVLTVLPPLTAPTIIAQPQSQSVKPGGSVTFAVGTASAGALTYQWQRNGVGIPGATNASLKLDGVEAPQGGTYRVVVENRAGKITSVGAVLTVDEIVPGHLTNLSVRSFTASGERTLIAGFAIAGARPKPLLIRTVGPTLRQFGIILAHLDPKISLMSGSQLIDVNDNWNSLSDTAKIKAVAGQLGAFALPEGGSDSALRLEVAPGVYSALAGSAIPASGTVLIELYDAEETFGRVTSRLTNVSARSQIGTGADVLIVGFVVAGQTPCRVLVRGIGPGLTEFNVLGALATPRLQLFRGQTRLDENENWESQVREIADASRTVGAFALRPGSRDTALIRSLEPGAYTAILSGAGNTTGIGLLEIYESP